MIDAEQLRKRLRRRSFVPMRFHMQDGRAFLLEDPDNVFLTKRTVHLGVDPEERYGIPGRVEYLPLQGLAHVEDVSRTE